MTRVLVVDDEPDIRALVADYLAAAGLAVETAPDAAALHARLRMGGIGLVVLGVNMPGETGLAALGRLRAHGDRTPVILLTAAGALPDRITGLADGADDYVVKPFEPRELLARVRAVLRRAPAAVAAPPPGSVPAVRIGRVSFDREARCLRTDDGAEIALTTIEFDLLSVFLRHPRQALGRALAPGDRSVDIRIARLRQKLGEDPDDPRMLRTIFGEGYRFDPDP